MKEAKPKNLTCAAASSGASGNPSMRRQILATIAAFWLVSSKAGEASRARSTKGSAAGERATSSTPGAWAGSGTARDDTGYSFSPRTRSGARLVASTVRPAHPFGGLRLRVRGALMLLALVWAARSFQRAKV
jgi:hypothetical protein